LPSARRSPHPATHGLDQHQLSFGPSSGPGLSDHGKECSLLQKTRASIPVSGFGGPLAALQESETIDVNRLVNSFQLGIRDLQEIWGLVLPPATLLELRKLARSTPEQFHLPDELWARIVCDFALA